MTALALGASLGLAAGLAPGPLHALVLTASLRRGFAAGARVALAPLITDAPIVAFSVAAVGALPGRVLPFLAGAGAVFLVVLGVATIREARRPDETGNDLAGVDLRRAVIANALSPHPWLFWIGVGGPLLVDAARNGVATAAGFLAGFYGLLVGTKVILAFAVARAGERLAAGKRRAAVAAGGLLLVGLGVVLGWQAASGRF